MKNNNTQRILGALFLALPLLALLFGGAWTVPSAAAAPMAASSNNEIDWTSLELCAAMGPDNCEAIEDTWTFTAPADGTVTVEFAAVSTNTGPDRNEVVDYSTSNGLSGRLGTVPPLPNTAQVEYEVMEGDQISGTFTHAPKEPGRKGGSLKVRVSGTFEPAPLPVDPTCESLGVVPSSGYAPLQVRFGGTWSDPDELVARAEVRTGDGGTVELADQTTGASYEYLNAGVYTAELVLIGHDGREFRGEACQANVEAIDPPILDFSVEVGASCANHILSGWTEGFASQEATLSVTAEAFGAEIGGTRQVGPGTFEFSAEKGGFEGLIPVTITATLMYEGELVAEAEFNQVLDCGTTPAPEPGQCLSASVSVANVPDEGAMVTVSAQAVGVQAVISVNGLQMGNAVPIINGAATFNVFVKPKDKIVVAVQGEDGAWSTTPACQLTIAGEPERCPSSFVTAYVYYDESRNGLWEAGNSIPALGTLDWQSAGEAGLNGVSVVVPTDFGSFSGTTQPNGWAFTSAFYSTTFFAQPIGGYASDGSPMPFMVNGEAWSLTGVATLATDGTGIQTPVNTWPLEEGGHCGARVFLVGLAPAAQSVADLAAPAWGLDAPTGEMVWSDVNVGQIVFDNGCAYAIIEVAGSATSQWDKGGLRRDRNLIGLHNMVGQTGCANPGAQVQNFAEYGGTVTVTLDGVTNVYTRHSAGFTSEGTTWESRLDNIAVGEGLTLFTCDGFDPATGDFAGYQVVSLTPAG